MGLSGTLGDAVLVRGKNGQFVRRRPTYRRPTSAGQATAAARLDAATTYYTTFTADEAEAWRTWAKTQKRYDAETGKTTTPVGYNLYCKLACKFLQVNPNGAIPRLPPTTSSLSGLPFLTIAATPTGVLVIASRANEPGVVTEILIQTLANARRTPTARYIHAAFVPFVGEGLSFELELPTGWYAFEAGAVRVASGQQSVRNRLGVVGVG